MTDEEMLHEYTMREIRLIEARQRARRRQWHYQRIKRGLPILGLVALGIAAVALAVLVGVN